MNRNVGQIDRYLRIFLGLTLIALPLLNMPQIWTSAIVANSTIAIGAILAATAIFGFCPAYRLLTISACKSK